MSTLPKKPLSRIERYLEYIALNGQPSPTGAYREETIDEDGYVTSVILHGYQVVPYSSFRDYALLVSVELPDTIKTIMAFSFASCLTLRTVNLENGLELIGQNAFNGCLSLKTIELPGTLKTIDARAFTNCGELASIVFPASLKTIGQSCFDSCYKLKTVTFKGTPTTINSTAFRNTGITTINVPWAEGDVLYAPWGATNATINYNYTGA